MLLAISFDKRRGGYSVVNHLSEGVDIEMTSGAMKYAVEVKSTEGSLVSLGNKDITGLRKKAADGYVPAIAVLRLHLSENWVIANSSNFSRFQPGDYTPVRLSQDSIPELELLAKEYFEPAVVGLRNDVLSPPGGAPLDFLAKVLVREESA